MQIFYASRVIERHKKNPFISGILIALFVLFSLSNHSHSQTIPPTNSSPVGYGVAPVGWTVIAGTTDISNKDFWAGWVGYPWYDVQVAVFN